MSDLFCAATLLLARDAEAEYDSPTLSDSGGSLSFRGREQAGALGRSLRDARVAMVYCSSMARAVQTAEIVAAELGVMVRVRDDLREWSVGDFAGQEYVEGMFLDTFLAWESGDLSAAIQGGETGTEVVERVRRELDTMVDMHRGETVLVVSHGGALMAALPRIASNIPLDYCAKHRLDYCDVVEVAADADGWVVRSWAAEPV